jgi:hypothetical protein
MEVDDAVFIFGEANVVPGKQAFAFRAKAEFAERPPVLVRITGLKEFQLAAFGLGKRGHRLRLAKG